MPALTVRGTSALRVQSGAETVDAAFRAWRRGTLLASVSSAVTSILAALIAAGTTVSSVGLLAVGVGVVTGTMVGWLYSRLAPSHDSAATAE